MVRNPTTVLAAESEFRPLARISDHKRKYSKKIKFKARGLAGFSIREPKNACGDNYICEVSIKIVSNNEKVAGVA